MRSRENPPLTVMSAVSAAILIFFAASERATSAEPRQVEGCGWAQHAAAAPALARVGPETGGLDPQARKAARTAGFTGNAPGGPEPLEH